jgi:hypothetical protein
MRGEPFRIAVDVDGVLAQFTAGFARVANAIEPGTFPPDYDALIHQTDWNFEDIGVPEALVNKTWDTIRDKVENFWLGLPTFQKEVHELHQFLESAPNDLEVFFVTSRVPSQGLTVLAQTQKWLRRYKLLRLGSSVIVKPRGVKKSVIYEALNISCSVDDYWPNVPSGLVTILGPKAEKHHGYLLARAWNEKHREDLELVNSLEEYFEKVVQHYRQNKK